MLNKPRFLLLIITALTSLIISVYGQSGPTCGTIPNPNGVCQIGTCSVGFQCELASQCSSACLGAGATSCYVCVNPIEVLACKIINLVETVLGILAILFSLIGGLLFAFSHFNANAGQHRSSMQGWAFGLLLAAVVMLALYLLATPIITLIASVGNLPIAQNPNVCSGIYF